MLDTKKQKYGEIYLKDWYKNTEKVLQKKYGVSHGLQIDKFLKKKIKTTLSRYGVENISQLLEIKLIKSIKLIKLNTPVSAQICK